MVDVSGGTGCVVRCEVNVWLGDMAVVGSLFFFFKQKTAYEMLRSLVGSEMCIRDRYSSITTLAPAFPNLPPNIEASS